MGCVGGNISEEFWWRGICNQNILYERKKFYFQLKKKTKKKLKWAFHEVPQEVIDTVTFKVYSHLHLKSAFFPCFHYFPTELSAKYTVLA